MHTNKHGAIKENYTKFTIVTTLVQYA